MWCSVVRTRWWWWPEQGSLSHIHLQGFGKCSLWHLHIHMGSYLCDWSSNGQKTRKRCRQRLPENLSIDSLCANRHLENLQTRYLLKQTATSHSWSFWIHLSSTKHIFQKEKGPRWLSTIFEFYRACRVLCGGFTQLLSSLSITLGLLSPVWTGEGTCGSSSFLSHESFIKGCREGRSEMPPEFSLKPGCP